MAIPDHPRKRNRWNSLLLKQNGFGLLLAAILAVLFWPVVSGAQSFFYRDYGVLGYPFVEYAKDRILSGEFPWWNPYSNTGAPFAAQWGTMCFYPGSLIYILLPLPWSLGLFSVIHLWFAGMGMRWLALKWTGSPAGATVAATVFVFNGAVLGSLMWPNWVAALAWMPWIVGWLSDASRDWWVVPKLALAGAAQLLTGVPELTVFTWLAGGVLALGMPTAGARNLATALIRLGAAFALVLLISAAQLVPFIELLQNSQRAGGSFSDARWPMPLTGWANLFMPLFRSFAAPDGQYFQFGQEFLSSYYVPLGAWLAGLLVTAKSADRRFWLLVGLTVFALWMALGPAGGLFSLVREVFPPIAVGRFPVKFVFLAVFTISLLTGAGCRDLAEGAMPSPKRLFVAVTSVGALVVLLIWLNHAGEAPYKPFQRTADAAANAAARIAWLAVGAGALVFARRGPGLRTFCMAAFCATLILDGLTHRPWQNPTIDSSAMEAGFWPANIARPKAGEGRLFISPSAEAVFLNDPSTNAQHSFLAKRFGQWSNLNLLDRIPKVNGSSTLQPRWQWEFQKALYAAPEAESEPMLDFLGVTATSSPTNAMALISRSTARPVVTAGQIAKPVDGTNAFPALLSREFRSLETVLVGPHETEALKRTQRARVETTILSFNPELIVFKANSSTPTIAVVAQSWLPGWKAEVGTENTGVIRANHAFMAVLIPAGLSEVRLRYSSDRWVAGIATSAVAALGCCAWWMMARRRLS